MLKRKIIVTYNRIILQFTSSMTNNTAIFYVILHDKDFNKQAPSSFFWINFINSCLLYQITDIPATHSSILNAKTNAMKEVRKGGRDVA